MTLAAPDLSSRPRFSEFELHELTYALEITPIVGDENTSCLAGGQRKENIVGEGFRDTGDLQAFFPCQLRQEIAGSVPRVGRWSNGPIRSREDPKNVLFERLSILRTLNPSSKFLGNDDAEVLEGREHAVELLKGIVRTAVTKRLNEQLRV